MAARFAPPLCGATGVSKTPNTGPLVGKPARQIRLKRFKFLGYCANAGPNFSAAVFNCELKSFDPEGTMHTDRTCMCIDVNICPPAGRKRLSSFEGFFCQDATVA